MSLRIILINGMMTTHNKTKHDKKHEYRIDNATFDGNPNFQIQREVSERLVSERERERVEIFLRFLSERI